MLIRGLIWQLTRLRFEGIILKGRGARIYIDRRVKVQGVIKIGNYATLDLRRTMTGRIGERFSLGDFSIFRACGSNDFTCPCIDIAERVSFGPWCNIGGGFGLKIKKNVIAGPYVSIHPEKHSLLQEIPIRDQPVIGEGIFIDEDCWLGSKATILDGSHLSRGTVVGASSLISNFRTTANTIYAGSPGRAIKVR